MKEGGFELDIAHTNVGIYIILNTINNKVYVGASKTLKNRFKRHRTELNMKVHPNKALVEDYHKYGPEALKFIIVEACKEDELRDKELYYMRKYNSLDSKFGYNLSVVKNDINLSCSDEYRKILSDATKGKAPSNLSSIQEMRRKPVNLFIDGVLVSTFQSLREAEIKLGIGRGNVHNYVKGVIKNMRGKFKNYHFEYKNKDDSQ